MNRLLMAAYLTGFFSVAGCQSTMPPKSNDETVKDVYSAVDEVTEAVVGKKLTDEEKKNLTKQLRENPEAQSAVRSITNTYGADGPRIKYSPVTGKRYAPHLVYDPENPDVKLLWVE